MSQVQALLDRFLADFDRLELADVSVVLHGSAARDQYLQGWSDINLLLVLPEVSIGTLERLRPLLQWWKQDGEALPLLLTREEWHRAGDAYPLEIAEMRTGYRVLRGPDPLAGLVVLLPDLRLALERELRGKLLRLRQVHALLGGDPAALGDIARRSVAALLVYCRGLLVLAGETPPADLADLVRRTAEVAGFPAPAVLRLVPHRGEEGWTCGASEFAEYLAAVERAARFVDHYQIGAHP